MTAQITASMISTALGGNIRKNGTGGLLYSRQFPQTLHRKKRCRRGESTRLSSINLKAMRTVQGVQNKEPAVRRASIGIWKSVLQWQGAVHKPTGGHKKIQARIVCELVEMQRTIVGKRWHENPKGVKINSELGQVPSGNHRRPKIISRSMRFWGERPREMTSPKPIGWPQLLQVKFVGPLHNSKHVIVLFSIVNLPA